MGHEEMRTGDENRRRGRQEMEAGGDGGRRI